MKKVFAVSLVVALLLCGCWPEDDSVSQPTWSNHKPPTVEPYQEWCVQGIDPYPCP